MKPSMYDKLIPPIDFEFAPYKKETDAKTRINLMETVFSKEHRAYSYIGTDEDNYKKLPKKWQKDEKLCLFLLDKDLSNYCFLCPEAKSNIKICLNLFKWTDEDKMVELIDEVPDEVKNNIDFVKMIAKDNVVNLSFLSGEWLKNDEIMDMAFKYDPANFFHILNKEHFTEAFVLKAFKSVPHSFFNADRDQIDDDTIALFEVVAEKQDSSYWIECFKNLNKEWFNDDVAPEELEDDFEIFDYIVDKHLTAEDIMSNFDEKQKFAPDDVFSSKIFELIKKKIKETIHKKQIVAIDKTDNSSNKSKMKRKMPLY